MKRKRNILNELNCKISQSNTILQNNKKIYLKIEILQNKCEICKIPVENYNYHINHKVCCSHYCFCVLYLSLQNRFIDDSSLCSARMLRDAPQGQATSEIKRDKYSFDENELMIIDNNTI